MSRVRPERAKPAAREKMEKSSVDSKKRVLRPKRSAMEPKKRRREPAVRLGNR
jgi:hypothetical protein